jgi:hypothetical protein
MKPLIFFFTLIAFLANLSAQYINIGLVALDILNGDFNDALGENFHGANKTVEAKFSLFNSHSDFSEKYKMVQR